MTDEEIYQKFQNFDNPSIKFIPCEEKKGFTFRNPYDKNNSIETACFCLIRSILFIVETDYGYFIILKNGVTKYIHKIHNYIKVYVPPVRYVESSGKTERDKTYCYLLFIYKDVFGGKISYTENSYIVNDKEKIPLNLILNVNFTSEYFIVDTYKKRYELPYNDAFMRHWKEGKSISSTVTFLN